MLVLTDVAQVDVLDEYGLLIVLSGIRYRSSLSLSISPRRLTTAFNRGPGDHVPLDALEAMDHLAGLKRAKRIAAHTSFFKSGICVGWTFVCVVKTGPLSSTIKIFEPIDQNIRGRNKPTFHKLLRRGNDTLQIYKEFYIPVELDTLFEHEAMRSV